MKSAPKTYGIPPFYTLKISEDGIAATYDFRTHQLAWHEVTAIQPNLNGTGLILRNVDLNKQIYINPSLKEYEEIVTLVKHKCPQIWNIQNIQEFHYGSFLPIIFLINCIVAIIFAFGEISKGFLWQSSITICLALLCLFWIIKTARRRLYFSGDSLVLQYWTRKQLIYARDIVDAQNYSLFTLRFKKKILPIAFLHPTLLKLTTNKEINIGGVKEGKQILESSLEKWLKAYSTVVIHKHL